MNLWKYRLNQLPGGLDDLQKAAGDLEIADRLRGQPFEIVVLVVQNRLPGRPARRERQEELMPPTGTSRQHLPPASQAQNLDS